MKTFTTEEIEGTRAHFEKQGFSEVEAMVLGHTFSFFVLPQGLEPGLPDFVFRCTGETEHPQVLGIADAFPEPWRKYAVFHEYAEFTLLKGVVAGHPCGLALQAELRAVREEGELSTQEREAYASRRAGFFHNLVAYCEGKPEYTVEDLAQFSRNALTLLTESYAP